MLFVISERLKSSPAGRMAWSSTSIEKGSSAIFRLGAHKLEYLAIFEDVD